MHGKVKNVKYNISKKCFILVDNSFLSCLENAVSGQDSLSKAAACPGTLLGLIRADCTGGSDNNGRFSEKSIIFTVLLMEETLRSS